jgi:hypothetical protein
MYIGCLIRSDGWSRGETQIEREPERSADSRNTADNIGPIDRAAIPSVCSGMSSFHEHCVGSTIISSNGTSLVEIPVKFLNANSFVVTTRGNMYIDVQ